MTRRKDLLMAFGTNSERRAHSKPGAVTLRAFHFRVEATDAQSVKLHGALDLAWELRNDQAALLEANRLTCRTAKQEGREPHYLSALALKRLVAADRLHPKFRALHSQVRQDLSLRVYEGQQRWFEALKAGRAGVKPPRPIARKHFRSLTYPQYGTAAHIKCGRLHLSKLGEFRLIGWRKMRGAKKSVTLKFKDGHWWAIVMCQVQRRDACRPYAQASAAGLTDVGVDPGIAAVMTDSLGESYDTPKPLKKAQAKLRHLQKDVSRKFEVRKKLHLENLAAARASASPGSRGATAPVSAGLVESLRTIAYSGRLKRSIRRLARAHTKVERVRDDTAKKTARRIEQRFSRVAVEEHSLQFMVKNRRTAHATADVAIGKQKWPLKSALGPGRYFEAKNTRLEGGNSQTCLCGAAVPKLLSQRWHKCADPACGLEGPRDQVSAVICQYETFGTLPQVSMKQGNSTPGLGVLEQSALAKAARLLEQRRGEGNGASGGRRRTQLSKSGSSARRSTVEPSAKRPAPRKGSMRPTTGGAQASSVVAETGGHAGLARSWSPEAKTRVLDKNPSTRLQKGARGLRPRSPLLQVGE